MVGLGVAFTDMNKENGSTRMIVGSHLWGPHDSCGELSTRGWNFTLMLQRETQFYF